MSEPKGYQNLSLSVSRFRGHMRRPSSVHTHTSPDVLSTKTSKNKKDWDGEGQGFCAPRTSRVVEIARMIGAELWRTPPCSWYTREFLPIYSLGIYSLGISHLLGDLRIPVPYHCARILLCRL